MMSLPGAVLVLAGAVGICRSMRLALAGREQELLSWLTAVRLLEREMTFGALPLPRVFCRVAEQAEGAAGEFFAALGACLQAGAACTLPDCWQAVLADKAAAWHLLPKDIAVLTDLGAALGQSSLGGQKKLLGLTAERLSGLAEESSARVLRLSRLLSGMGWCCGLLIICLWL